MIKEIAEFHRRAFVFWREDAGPSEKREHAIYKWRVCEGPVFW